MNKEKIIIQTLQWLHEITSDFKYIPKILPKKEFNVSNIFLKKIKNCAIKSFLAQKFLKSIGIEVKIINGFLKTNGRIYHHVWIGCQRKEYDPSAKDFKVSKNSHIKKYIYHGNCPDCKRKSNIVDPRK